MLKHDDIISTSVVHSRIWYHCCCMYGTAHAQHHTHKLVASASLACVKTVNTHEAPWLAREQVCEYDVALGLYGTP